MKPFLFCRVRHCDVAPVLIVLGLTLTVLGSAWAAAPVIDGTVSPNSLQQIIKNQQDLEARLKRIERGNSSVLEMIKRMDSLQKEVQKIMGDLEVQTHTVSSMKKRQRNLYLDIDRRLGKMEKNLAAMQQAMKSGGAPALAATPAGGTSGKPVTGASGKSPQSAGKVPSSPSSQTEVAAYESAFNLLKKGRYDMAAVSFQAFIESFPKAKYADNAQYWLGEANFVQRKYEAAITEFKKVVDNYPNSPKLPDALLKMGFAHNELGNKKSAIEVLERIVKQYNGTTAARLAKKRLITIKGG